MAKTPSTLKKCFAAHDAPSASAFFASLCDPTALQALVAQFLFCCEIGAQVPERHFGATTTVTTNKTPTTSTFSSEEMVTVTICWTEPSSRAPITGPRKVARAAEDRHSQRRYGVVHAKNRCRLNKALVHRQHGARHSLISAPDTVQANSFNFSGWDAATLCQPARRPGAPEGRAQSMRFRCSAPRVPTARSATDGKQHFVVGPKLCPHRRTQQRYAHSSGKMLSTSAP